MAAAEADVLAGRFSPRGVDSGGVTVTTSANSRALTGAEPTAEGEPGGVMAQLLNQPLIRKAAPLLAIALVATLAVVAFVTLSAVPPRALYPEMADADKETAQQLLRKGGIKVELDAVTGNLMVSQKDFHEARITLASAGLPHQAATGISGLKGSMPLGTSQFMEQMHYNASVEEELAQSIRRINAVQDARVHLALPRQSAFVRDHVDPKASVIVTPYSGRALSEGQVQAIVHLVSSSIPYMSPAGVSVVDQFGRLLTDTSDGKDVGNKQLALRQKLESDYADRVVALLSPLYGAANVRAQVAVDMDFSMVEQTFENFDPNEKGTKVRSEQVKQSQTRDDKASGVPGSLSNSPPDPTMPVTAANLPPESANGSSAASVRDTESSAARNFEIDRSVRYVVDQTPHLTRLSVAVTINDAIVAPGATEPPARKPLPDAEVTRLTDLVKGAVGFNGQRGDVVNLISASFEPPVADVPVPIWQQQQYLDLARYIAIAAAIALAALFVVRPVVARLTAVPAGPTPEEIRGYLEQQGINAGGPAAAPREDAAEESETLRDGETIEQFKSRMKPKKSGISAEMLDTANSYDDKVTVVRMLVSQDARRVALVLKNLIARELN